MRCATRFLLLAAVLASVANPANAADKHAAKAHIDFQIRIPHVLQMSLSGQPAAIRVTQEDIERGEVVVRGARVRLVSNSRNGFRVRAELSGEAFVGAALHGLATPVEVQERVAVTWMRSTVGGASPQPVEVEYRFRLAPGARPGDYAWPLALTLENA